MDSNQHRGRAALGRPGGNFVVVEAKPEEEDPEYSRYAHDRALSNLHQPVPQGSVPIHHQIHLKAGAPHCPNHLLFKLIRIPIILVLLLRKQVTDYSSANTAQQWGWFTCHLCCLQRCCFEGPRYLG
ncbi:hypothetical protein E8E14_000574 [Neopestalotiopsis sp. 37M]|nr:hypothetical protein E8E14_000574 [Neopestalotiopsis sp. 37M]